MQDAVLCGTGNVCRQRWLLQSHFAFFLHARSLPLDTPQGYRDELSLQPRGLGTMARALSPISTLISLAQRHNAAQPHVANGEQPTKQQSPFLRNRLPLPRLCPRRLRCKSTEALETSRINYSPMASRVESAWGLAKGPDAVQGSVTQPRDSEFSAVAEHMTRLRVISRDPTLP
jgi:hypothetical protein